MININPSQLLVQYTIRDNKQSAWNAHNIARKQNPTMDAHSPLNMPNSHTTQNATRLHQRPNHDLLSRDAHILPRQSYPMYNSNTKRTFLTAATDSYNNYDNTLCYSNSLCYSLHITCTVKPCVHYRPLRMCEVGGMR